MVYTFYSYKGGVGRSMALANVAELFYQRGLKVLMVDWDLEAPGLERFFAVDLESVLDHPGVVNLLVNYKHRISQPLPEQGEASSSPLQLVEIGDYLFDVYPNNKGEGKLWLIPAGRRSGDHFDEYANLLRNFDWHDFYQNWEGELFFDWLRRELLKQADVVLVDSRTGVTEMGGVCVYQLADVVVMFCTSSRQSIDGTYQMARNFKGPDVVELRRGRPLELLFVPSRVEHAEAELLDQFAQQFDQLLSRFLAPRLSFERNAFLDLKTPYVPYYAYIEKVAVREPQRASGSDLAEAFERLGSTLVQLAPEESRLHRAYGTLLGKPHGVPAAYQRGNNLPRRLSPFIGREQELVEVKHILSSSRLLTLTGPGGIGKTRLAYQAAADLVDEFADGVWVVELAPLADSALVPQAVASALQVREDPGRPLVETLADYLRTKSLLIVLDTCEHLVLACAELADFLLRGSPGLRLLATSRETLGIDGEQILHVPSLAFPSPQALPPVEELSRYDAIRLFVDRATLSQPDFTVTDRNAQYVVQICQRLDGIPLAIELAAARVREMSVAGIAHRLDDWTRLLTRGSRTALPRQQTLRATLDWSYELLTKAEQALLRRLSAFEGGWTLEAAEGVCAGEAFKEWEILELLITLANKSLVDVAKRGEETRYRLLETLRRYGCDRLLEAGEEPAVRRRHLHYFLQLAEAADANLFGPDQSEWFERLEREHANLRAALHWSVEMGETEAGLRLGGALRQFWAVRGYLSEGRRWLARLLALPGASARTAARAKALDGAGKLAQEQGDSEAARALHEESLVIARELGDKRGIVISLSNLGIVALVQGDYSAARTLLEESLLIARELGDKRGIAISLNNLGNIAQEQGDYEAARSLHEESLAIARELGDVQGIARSLGNLGSVAHAQMNYAEARARYEESLSIRRELGDKRGIAISLNNLGTIAQKRDSGEEARTLLKESLSIARELGDKLAIASSLEELAAVAEKQQQPERAARLFGAAGAIRDFIGAPLSPSDRADYDLRVTAARTALGAEAFAAAWAEGQAITLEQSVAYALKDAPAG